jgi:uroporphyrinogen-III decarboxylase
MVWSEGAFMHPDFYRGAIFPRYKALWRVLKEAGVKVLFCSDGNFGEFLEDIAEAGAEGFIFEPLVDFDRVVERFGSSHVIVGSKVDCRTLTFGKPEDIAREIEATWQATQGCRGHMMAVGNHIPSNVPLSNALFYMDTVRRTWTREGGGISRVL